MSTQTVSENTLLRQLLIALAQLSADDLPVVMEFVNVLQKQPHTPSAPRLQAADLRALAHQRAAQLRAVPRPQLAAQFAALVAELRAEATPEPEAQDE